MTRAIRTLLIAWVLLLGLYAGGQASAQATQDEPAAGRERVEELVAEHVANDRLQTERPEWKPDLPDFEPPPKPNPFIKAIGDFFAWVFRNLAGVFGYLLIAAITGAVLYALWYMFGDVVGFRLSRKPRKAGPELSEQPDDRPARHQATALLDEADQLAAKGRFAEAVHLLLFRSIEDVRERRAGGIPESLTAREIQSLTDLSARAREALGPIIRIVENSFFGGRPVDKDGWQRARSSYEHFAFGEVTA